MAIVTITCENDADFIRGFSYQDLSGDPIDLTGQTMRMGIRKHAADVTELLELTTENGGITITDAPGGAFTIYISDDQLVRMPIGQYDHSLVRMQGTATLRIWSGTIIVNPGASRVVSPEPGEATVVARSVDQLHLRAEAPIARKKAR
jgi:hypothetical protein